MTDKTHTNTSQTQAASQEPRQTNLRNQYGEIGIPAVAAAARYAGDSKARHEAEPAMRIDQRFIEVAA